MPALSTALLSSIADSQQHATLRSLGQLANSSSSGLQVVCAWPVSGQYGPGARVLYYVLVAVCLFARKAKWLTRPCLAATLLFPAVAALHGIVLAAVHKDGRYSNVWKTRSLLIVIVVGAVDMDIYGAFQLCSTGALAAPVTVRVSSTYETSPGRNAIFGWSSIVLAGLLSLTIEFYRSSTTTCRPTEPGITVSNNARKFPYGNTQCGLVCSVADGPFSPIRGGSGDNIDVIPAPDILTFDAGMTLAAACCIPAILLLIGMMIRNLSTDPLESSMMDSERHSDGESFSTPVVQSDADGQRDESEENKKPNRVILWLQKYLEIPVFGAAIIAIVAFGERNLFSHQLQYDTEPMANIGQWAPVVGITLAVLGSFYVLIAEAIDQERKLNRLKNPDDDSDDRGGDRLIPTRIHDPDSDTWSFTRTIARLLIRFGEYFSTGQTQNITFRGSAADDYPEVPGEENRNAQLHRVRSQYRDPSPSIELTADGRRPRVGSSGGSTVSGAALESPGSQRSAEVPLERRETLEVPSPSHGRRSEDVIPIRRMRTPSIVIQSVDPG